MNHKILQKEYVIKNGVNFEELEQDLFTQRILQSGTEDQGFTGLTYELYSDGSLAYYCFYEYGEKHGEYVEFHKNGLIKSFKVMDYGTVLGEYECWDERGNLIETGEKCLGIKLRYKKWDNNGMIIKNKENPTEADIDWITKRKKDREESMNTFKEWLSKN